MSTLTPDDIRRLLKGDGITGRAQGLKACEALMQDDTHYVAATSKEWSGIVQASLEYEVKEMDYAQKKNKDVKIDVAKFVKKLVKHSLLLSRIIPKRVNDILKRSLTVLYDQDISMQYKSEYKAIVFDILDAKIVPAISEDVFHHILIYLKETMIDRRSIEDASNLRILRCFCKNVFLDHCFSHSFMVEVMEWFPILVTEISSAGPASVTSVLSVVADCCASILEFDGVNNLTLVFETLQIPFNGFIHQLSTYSLGDNSRNSFLRFLLVYCDKCSTLCFNKYDSVVAAWNPLSEYLDRISVALTNDELLRALIILALQSLRPIAGLFCNVSDDPKTRLHFEVSARIVCFYQLQWLGQEAQSWNNSLTTVGLSQSSPSLTTSRNGLNRLMSSRDTTPRYASGAATVAVSPVNALLQRLLSADISQAKRRHALCNVGGGFSQSSATSCAGSQPFGSGTTTTTTTAVGHTRLVVEGLGLLIVSLCRLFPKGQFLQASKHESLTSTAEQLCNFVSIVLKKILETGESVNPGSGIGISNSIIGDTQVQGALLLALKSLILVSKSLLEENIHHTNIDACSTMLSQSWARVVQALTAHSGMRRSCQSCRCHSIADILFSVLDTVLRSGIVDDADSWTLSQLVWPLLPVADPRGVESPSFFSLLAYLLNASPEHAPVDKFCELFFDDISAEDIAAAAVGGGVSGGATSVVSHAAGGGFGISSTPWSQTGAASSHADSLLATASDLQLTGKMQPLLFIASWILAHGTSTGGKVLDCTDVMAAAIHKVVRAVMMTPHSCKSTSACEDFDSSEELSWRQRKIDRDFVAFAYVGHARHWFQSALSGPTNECIFGYDNFCRPTSMNCKNSRSRSGSSGYNISSIGSSGSSSGHRGRVGMGLSRAASGDVDLTAAITIDGESLTAFVELLHVVAEAVDERLTCETRTGSNESVATRCHAAALVLCSVYLGLITDGARDIDVSASALIEADFWALFLSLLRSLHPRLRNNNRWEQFYAVLPQIQYMCQLASSCFNRGGGASGTRLSSQESMQEAVEALIELCRTIRDDCNLATNTAYSSSSTSALDGGDFDVMDMHSQASISGTNTKKRSSAVLSLDDDDDFMEAEEAHTVKKASQSSSRMALSQQGRDRGRIGGGGGARTERLSVSPEQANAYATITQCVAFLSTNDKDVKTTFDFLKRRKDTGGTGGGGEMMGGSSAPLCVQSEVQLIVASKLVEVNPIVAIKSFIFQSAFDAEMGVLGYLDVLCTIRTLAHSDYFEASTVESEDLLQHCIPLIFADSDAISSFPETFWQVRIVQMQCVARLCQAGLYAQLNDPQVKRMFKSGLSDRDYRVRIATAQQLPVLLTLFQRHLKMYETLIKSTGIEIVSPLIRLRRSAAGKSRSSQAELSSSDLATLAASTGCADSSSSDGADCLLAVSTVIGAAYMAASSDQLLKVALFDILRVTCSRVISPTSDALAGRERLLSQATSVGEVEMSPCARPVVDMVAFLGCIMKFLSERLGYANPGLLILDHFQWLLSQWIAPSTPTSGRASVSAADFTIDEFPWALMVQGTPGGVGGSSGGGGGSGSGGGSKSQWSAYVSCLMEYQDLILPVVGQLENRPYRFKMLERIAYDLGFGKSDAHIAQLITSALPSIKATEFFAYYLGQSLAEAEQKSAFEKISQNLQDLVSRLISTSAVAEQTKFYISKIVSSLLTTNPYFGDEFESESLSIEGNTRRRDVFTTALASMSTLVGDSDYHVLSSCNVIELLASLRCRLLETKLPAYRSSLLASVRTVIEFVALNPAWLAVRSCLSTLIASIRNSSAEIEIICLSLRELAEGLVGSLHSLPRKKGKKHDSAKFVTRHGDVLSELLAETVCLNYSLLYTMGRRTGIDGSRNRSSGSSEGISEDRDEVDRDNVGGFVTVYHKDMVANLFARDSMNIEHNRDQVTSNCLEHLAAVAASIQRVAHNTGTEDISCWLPLPRSIISSLSSDCRAAVEGLTTSDSHSQIVDLVTSLTAVLGRHLAGETMSMAFIWLQICNVREALEGPLGPDLLLETSQRPPTVCLWLQHADLASSFISALISICECGSSNVSFGHDRDLHAHLVHASMTVIGLIGPPGAFALNHERLPSKPGDALIACGGNIEKLKSRLMLKMFGMLWHDPATCREAEKALSPLNTGALHEQWGKCMVDDLALRDVINEWLMSRDVAYPGAMADISQASAAYTDRPERAEIEGSDSKKWRAWTAELWATDGKTYEQWICAISSSLIEDCYTHQTSLPTSTAASLRSIQRQLNEPQPFIQLNGSDDFLRSLGRLCALQPSLAEGVFPLIIFDLLTSPSDADGGSGLGGGSGSGSGQAIEIISDIFLGLLSDTCSLARATQLACSTIHFLLRQNIQKFLLRPRLSSQAIKAREQAAVGSAPRRLQLPYTFLLTIDPKLVAVAAVRCGMPCTALQFAELAIDMASPPPPEPSAPPLSVSLLPTPSALAPAPPAMASSSTGKCPTSSSVYDSHLMADITKGLHDPDAIFGVHQRGSDLRLQALQYAQTGRWVEALATYESILMQARGQDTDARVAAVTGVAVSLGGLGYQHTLTSWAESMAVDDRGSGSSSSSGRAAGRHSSYASGRSPSVRNIGTSQFDEIRSLCSESSWKSIGLLQPDKVSRSFLSDVNAQSAWARRPEQSGGTSRSAVGRGGVTQRASLGSVGIRPALPTGPSLAAASVSQAPQRCGSAVAAAPGASERQASTEYWNHLMSCNIANVSAVSTLASAEQQLQAGARLYPFLALASTEQSATKMTVDLGRAQQLIEIREYDQVRTASGQQRSHTADRMIHKWASRSQAVGASRPLEKAAELVISLRLSLVGRLVATDKVSPLQAYRFVEAMHECMLASKATAHALSPLIYNLREQVELVLHSPSSSFKASSSLAAAAWGLHECKLLWTKGLGEAAQDIIETGVIDPLRRRGGVVGADSTSTSTSSSTIEEAVFSQDLLSEALRTRGEWAISNRTAASTVIETEYLLPAVQFAGSDEKKQKAHATLGAFMARLYQTAKVRISSQEWKHMERVADDRRKELERCTQLLEAMKADKKRRGERLTGSEPEVVQLSRHTVALTKETAVDEKQRSQVVASVQHYFRHAITNLGIVLKISKCLDLESVCQFVNLWLDNSGSSECNSLVERVLGDIPTYKLVPLAYQLFSRLDAAFDPCGTASGAALPSTGSVEADSGFQRVLQQLLLQLCVDHPHHCLLQLFALVNSSDVDLKTYQSNTSNTRSDAAKALVGRMKRHRSDSFRELVKSTDTLFLAYISLAKCCTKRFVTTNRTKNIAFKELVDRTAVPFCNCLDEIVAANSVAPSVVTSVIPLRPDRDYSDVVKVCQFDPVFSLTDSGISRPKIISCLGSDGRKYKQLVKSGDDMRQDAVMQQVFEFVNYILNREEETRKRHLSVRTYKIVPTTPQTGVLQWVDNTEPFGFYLTGRDGGAHARYYPGDWSNSHCREVLKATVGDDPVDKFRVLGEIYDHFRPVFRFFLLESFPEPTKWVSRRLAYTRSVAVTSIVGYILGIGDRHVHNIMVDTKTAEVVHIDFGIVFEQGKALLTPETVPFRLTRDIVDAMGVCGCEGTFRRSCEEVLRVMRESSQPLLTILEVVIHDPLYKWNLSPQQARQRQQGGQERLLQNQQERTVQHLDRVAVAEMGQSVATQGQFGRDAAQRALARIKAKLQGFEDPTGDGLSVEGQVDFLINEARAKENLCKIYYGWAPWL